MLDLEWIIVVRMSTKMISGLSLIIFPFLEFIGIQLVSTFHFNLIFRYYYETWKFHIRLASVGFDLCILASSDHSIHTYGTFGLWGSLLAGGDVIVSKGRNENGLTEEDNIYKWSAMPGWLYIDTLNPEKISVLKLDNKTREFVETDTY